MNSDMQMVAICEEFGWTYDEYMNQPAHFIVLIKEKLSRDRKAQEMEHKKMRYGR